MFARRSLHLAVAFGLSLAMLPAAMPAQAADDEAIDTRIMRGLMEGLGFKKDGEAIVYQERAPLVIPPSSNLPMPEKADAAIANNPAWPKDPDIKRKRDAAKLAREQAVRSADDKLRDEQRVLRPNELTPGATAANPAPRMSSADRSASTFRESGDRLTPSQLGYRGGIFGGMFGSKKDDEQARFTGEPPRASLTDPPPGYQTPSADQPYGATDRAWVPKATNYYESKGGNMER